jgi:hypothetical protein
MWQTSTSGNLRNRFEDNSRVFHPETAKDFASRITPGHIYNSHVHKSLAPPNINTVKKLHNYSFGREIREANDPKTKVRKPSPSPTDYKLT